MDDLFQFWMRLSNGFPIDDKNFCNLWMIQGYVQHALTHHASSSCDDNLHAQMIL